MTTIDTIYNQYRTNYRLTTDSRSIEPGIIYLALRGERFDGNQFAQQALDKGASLVIIDNDSYDIQDDRVILVDDGLRTLQHLAKKHRQVLNIPVVALTGSNGKTTTKELMHQALSTRYIVHATSGNFNNHIGVPLTILKATPDHEIMIVEMGANHVGEIEELCKIAMPDIGLITNIGKAHLEGFGGYQGVIKAKSEMYVHLKSTGSTIIYNEEDELLKSIVGDYFPRVAYSPVRDFKLIHSYPNLSFEYSSKQYSTQLVGEYNLANISTAIAVGSLLNCTTEDMLNNICNYSPTNNRSQSISKAGIHFILDAYNANPSSMELAIKGFSESSFSDKVLILGDMLELGEASQQEHEKTIKECTVLEMTEVIFVGPIFKTFESAYSRFKFFDSVDELSSTIAIIKQGAHCFVKGSRALKLEKILEFLD